AARVEVGSRSRELLGPVNSAVRRAEDPVSGVLLTPVVDERPADGGREELVVDGVVPCQNRLRRTRAWRRGARKTWTWPEIDQPRDERHRERGRNQGDCASRAPAQGRLLGRLHRLRDRL